MSWPAPDPIADVLSRHAYRDVTLVGSVEGEGVHTGLMLSLRAQATRSAR